METSIHTEINRLDTGLKQLAFAIGQGVDRETLHGNIIELRTGEISSNGDFLVTQKTKGLGFMRNTALSL